MRKKTPKKKIRKARFGTTNPESMYGRLLKINMMPPPAKVTKKNRKGGRHEAYTPDQVIAALQSCRGLQFLAAKKLGVHPETIANMKKRYPQIQTAIDSMKGEWVDRAEGKLYQSIKKRDPWAVCFFLKTQGKDRGYIERVQNETSGRDGKPIETRIDVSERAARVAGLLLRLRSKGAFGLPGRSGPGDPAVDADSGTAVDRVQESG